MGESFLHCLFSAPFSWAAEHVEQVSALAFDNTQELLWAGTNGGSLAALHHPAGATYSRRKALVDGPTVGIVPLGGGAIAAGGTQLRCFSGGCMLLHSHTFASSRAACIAEESRTHDNNAVVVGFESSGLEAYDIEAQAVKQETYTERAVTALAPCRAGMFATGDSGGEVALRDSRSGFKAEQVFKAHKQAVLGVDGRENYLATCGQQEPFTPDPLVRVFDVRAGAKPLSTLPFSQGPTMLRFSHKLASALIVASGSTSTFMFADAHLSAPQWVQEVDTEGTGLGSMAMSSSGNALAFGDGGGYFHIWSSPTDFSANIATEYPEDAPLKPREYAPASEATAQIPDPEVQVDTGSPALSDCDMTSPVRVGLPPRELPEAVRNRLVQVDFWAYAPNPAYRSGAGAGEATRAVAKVLNRRVARGYSRSKTANPAVPEAYRYREAQEQGPPLSSKRWKDQERNLTPFAGLENGLPNCYANPVLQVMNFNPELRVGALSHLCERDACTTCELNFLFYMLRKSSGGHSCQPQNLLRSLRQVREAAALGLLEGDNELEARLDDSLVRRIQGFQRFLLEQLHKEHHRAPTEGTCTIAEDAFGCNVHQVTECLSCGTASERWMDSFQIDLHYPSQARGQSQQRPSFSQLLETSLARTSELRAWCDSERSFRRMKQSRSVANLPKTLIIGCGVSSSKDLRVWGVDPSASATDGDAYYGDSWLPYSLFVSVNSESRAAHVQEADSPEQLGEQARLENGDSGVYVLTGLVCLVRDWSVEFVGSEAAGSPADSTPPDSEGKHLVAHINVDSNYIELQLENNSPEQLAMFESTSPGWYLFNDFTIVPTSDEEVTRLYGTNKTPCLAYYRRLSGQHTPRDPDARILDKERFLRLLQPQAQSSKFEPLSEQEVGSPEHVGIDAEFVALTPPEKEVTPDGGERVIRQSRLGLARVSVVRGEGPHQGLACIDDYVSAVEPVYDYLTKFSGLVPGDIDPWSSQQNLVTLKEAYLKLRYLVDAGFTFIGHGLNKDFRMINIFVPQDQVVDTVELFHLPQQRKISLRFLAAFFLGLDVQTLTHDSIEDAHTAVRLYDVCKQLRRNGILKTKLQELYRYGKSYAWEVTEEVLELGKSQRSQILGSANEYEQEGRD